MVRDICILDYGVGNILSISRAIEKIGYKPNILSDLDKINESKKIIIPGVGAFKSVMKKLKKNKLDILIKNLFLSDKVILGICVGMQILYNKSYEFGENEGLKFFNGDVSMIKTKNKSFRVPHIGWSEIEILKNDPITKYITNNDKFYFVHSYKCNNFSNKDIISETLYDFDKFTSISKKKKVYGCQFHPEKSGDSGLRFLKGFAEI